MQLDLLGIDVTIRGEDFAGIPLITRSGHKDVEVQVPGHTYEPVLIQHVSGELDVGPGALIPSEKRFVIDLLKYLCPNENFPKHPSSPIEKDGIEYYLRRNLSNNEGSARFRIDSENWFYPDFVLWIVDRSKCEQIIAFVDPKGLRTLEGGWKNHKILCSLFSVSEAQVSLEKNSQPIKDESGQPFKVRLASVIVSTTPYKNLAYATQFNLGGNRIPTVEEFNSAGIWFPDDQSSYIEKILESLRKPSEILKSMRYAARHWVDLSVAPATELECYLASLLIESDSDEKSPILEVFLRNTLGGGATAKELCRSKLYEKAKNGLFGVGADFKGIQDDESPCRSWFEWLSKNHVKQVGLAQTANDQKPFASARDLNV